MIPAADQDLRSPSQAQTIGMWLFLLTLAILFAAGMLGYGVVRLTSPAIPDNFHLHLPQALWLSTILVLAASYTAHRAVVSIIHNKPAISQRWMGVTTALALGFLLVQTPSMLLLLADHAKLLSAACRCMDWSFRWCWFMLPMFSAVSSLWSSPGDTPWLVSTPTRTTAVSIAAPCTGIFLMSSGWPCLEPCRFLAEQMQVGSPSTGIILNTQ